MYTVLALVTGTVRVTVVGTKQSPLMVIVAPAMTVSVVGAHLWLLQVVIVNVVCAGQ